VTLQYDKTYNKSVIAQQRSYCVQQYFNYIVAVSIIGLGVPGENHRPAASH